MAHTPDELRRLFTDEYTQLSTDLSQTSWNRVLPWNGEEIIEAVALATVHDLDGVGRITDNPPDSSSQPGGSTGQPS